MANINTPKPAGISQNKKGGNQKDRATSSESPDLDLEEATQIIEETVERDIFQNTGENVFQNVIDIGELLNENRSDYMRDIPELYHRLEMALARSQWYCLDKLLPEEVAVLFKEHLEFLFRYSLENLQTKIDLVMRSETRWELRNDYKQKIREAMQEATAEVGEQQISFGDSTVKPTVQNWFRDWRNFLGEQKPTSLLVLQYLNASDNVKQLSKKDRDSLEKLFKVYIYLLRDSMTDEGSEERLVEADPVTGTYMEWKRGERMDTGLKIPPDELVEFRKYAGLDEEGKPMTLSKYVKTEEFKQELKKHYAQPVQHQEKKTEKNNEPPKKKIEPPKKIHAGLPPLPEINETKEAKNKAKKSATFFAKLKPKTTKPTASPAPAAPSKMKPSKIQTLADVPAPPVPPAPPAPPVSAMPSTPPAPKPPAPQTQGLPKVSVPPISSVPAQPAPPAPKPYKTTEQVLKELDYKKIAQHVLGEHKILLGSADLEKRFVSVMVSYLRGTRDKMEVREALSRAPQEGGVNLPAEQIDDIIDTADKMISRATQKPHTAPIKSAKELAGKKKPTLEMVQKRMAHHRSTAKARGEELVSTKKEDELEDILATVSPIFNQEMQKVAAAHKARTKDADGKSKKPVIADIAYPSAQEAQVVMGPIDELRSLNLVEFRRLSDDPKQAVQAIIDKAHLLEEESVAKKAEGIAAWQESPLNQAYLQVGNQSLEKSIPVAELLTQMYEENEGAMNQEEFDAIADLNRQLRF